jgi:hypothetical protein
MSHLHPNLDRVRRVLSAAALALCCAALVPVSGRAQDPASPQGQGGPQNQGTGPVRETSLVPPPPAPEDVTLLRLRETGPRFGAIVGHSADHLEFALLATGGLVRVPWSMIEPGQSAELQSRFGYVDIVAEEIMIDAERLVLTSGGSIEGIIVSREGDSYLVKSEGNLQAVPKSRVQTIEQGLRVPALDVYSAEELYNQYAALASPTDPASQWELAETCERLYAFGRAAEHYAKVAELDPTYRAAELANILPRVRQKMDNQVQLEYLREADRLRKRGQWDKALERVQAFDELYPNSPLLLDAQKQEARLVQARDAFAKEYVKGRWFHWMGKLTRELAKENTLAAARAYADEQLSEEIQKAVLADLQREIWKDAQLEQVKQIFAGRRKVQYKATTYSNGTWLIGAEAAQRGAEEADPAAAEPTSETDANRDALAQRIKQFMKNQQIASRGKKAEDQEDLAQRFWELFSSNDRSMWLLAYYVENSGDLEVRPRPTLIPCNTCAGKGAIEILLTGGGSAPEETRSGGGNANSGQQLQTCPTCQGVQVVRRVHYR